MAGPPIQVSATSPSSAQTLVTGGKFVSAPRVNLTTTWATDLADFEQLIDPSAHPKGVDEDTLLTWFGATSHRIALIAFALTGIPPTHVAREFSVGKFRVDFAWASIQTGVFPTFGFVEFQDALEDTLFRKGPETDSIYRQVFSNTDLVNLWIGVALVRTRYKRMAAVSASVGAHSYAHRTEYRYALLAGLVALYARRIQP